jgi:hypothetical protein
MYTNLDSGETDMHTEKKAYKLGQIIAFHNAGLIGQEKVGMLLEKVAEIPEDYAEEFADRMRRGAERAERAGTGEKVVSEAEDVFKNLGKHKGKIIGGTLGAGALLGGTIGAGLGSWSDEPGSVARGGMTGMGAGAGTGAGLLGSGALVANLLRSAEAAEATGKIPGRLGTYGKAIAALGLPIAGMVGGGALGHWAGNKATGHTDTAAPRR